VSIRTTRRAWLVLAIALALLPATAVAQATGEPQPILDQEPLTIETAGGPVTFLVEMARTPAEQSRGLMFRTLVPPGTGMLFVHTRPRQVSMWMRNTPTALDMLFIDQDGTIESIARDTTPFSETVISSNGPVAGVLEIRAGEAERLGIQEGDRVRHPHFNPK
jgi:uncharacterized protein